MFNYEQQARARQYGSLIADDLNDLLLGEGCFLTDKDQAELELKIGNLIGEYIAFYHEIRSTYNETNLKTRCDSCDEEHGSLTLIEPKDLWARVTVGGEVPAGECPDCGALCYLVKDSTPPGQATTKPAVR